MRDGARRTAANIAKLPSAVFEDVQAVNAAPSLEIVEWLTL
jgi:hypothetical protein